MTAVDDSAMPTDEALADEEQKQRRRLLLLLLFFALMIVVLTAILVTYLINPAPLPDLFNIDADYAPHYLFSIYEVDQPVGVALSPDDDLIYVSESGGERLIKIFNRNGDLVGSFSALGTTPSSRAPVYLDTDQQGRVFVTDRLQHGVFVFDEQGTYLDTLLDPNDTLSENLIDSGCILEEGTGFSFNAFEGLIRCTGPDGGEQTFPLPILDTWSPLGIRIGEDGRVLVTDLVKDEHRVRYDTGDSTSDPSRWELVALTSGATGQEPDQLLFPNVAVADSKDRVYVTDGNNGRVSIWDEQGAFLGTVGTGSGDGALGLPRGAAINSRDRLHVVDAVGQDIKVYDVSGIEPVFLFTFGQEGLGDGQFSFPGDIAIDGSGRLYITDRANNRIQVWSY